MRARMLSLATALTVSLCALPAGALTFFDVASGDVDGGYFEATRAICAIVNAKNPDVLRCSPESTPGSLYNINALRAGDVDFALAQSDWQRRAYEGTDMFASAGPLEDLRGVMGLYSEEVTVLVSRDSGIGTLLDLRGKIVDIGQPASGRRGTVMYFSGPSVWRTNSSRTSGICRRGRRSRRSATARSTRRSSSSDTRAGRSTARFPNAARG